MVAQSRMMGRPLSLRLDRGSQDHCLFRAQKSSWSHSVKLGSARIDLLHDHLAPDLTSWQTAVVGDSLIRSPADQGCPAAQ